jgi:hypothetical protein
MGRRIRRSSGQEQRGKGASAMLLLEDEVMKALYKIDPLDVITIGAMTMGVYPVNEEVLEKLRQQEKLIIIRGRRF